ncbi:MAG: 50S ribosomal protein L24 [Candidatus Omnitrophica bacterium]|nr:50S ribosomal protein L24 [Candidatus Omnitrophota bacterium]
MLRIKKNDQVIVTVGKEKGKSGKVVRVFPKEHTAVVENLNIIKRSVKKSDTFPQGGYIEKEKPISLSNLMLLDKKENKPTRFIAKVLKDGAKVRIAQKTGETI